MTTQIDFKKNIRFLYGYSFFQMFLVCIPVLVPYWNGLGLSISEIFLLQGIFGGVLIVFDLPAGYLADLFGRKKAMLIGSAISAIGYQVLWLGTSFYHFVLFEVIVAIGLCLQSGCDIAILFSSAEKSGQKNEIGNLLSKRLSIQTFSEGIASLCAAGLTIISIQLPIIVNAFTPWLMVCFAFFIKEPPSIRLNTQSHISNFKLIGKALFGHSKLLTIIIVTFVVYSFATYCAVWSLQPYWGEKDIAPKYFGLLWAANSFLTAIVGFNAKRIEKKIGPSWTILIITIAPIVGYLGLGFAGGLFALVFSIFFPLCRGLNGVLFQEALNSRIPDEIRATANSMGSLGMRALFLLFGPLLGWAIDQNGPAAAMKMMGYIFTGLFILVAIPLLRLRNEFKVH